MNVATAPPSGLPELYQTEWCPASRRVRQRLTELDLTYVVRQVPVERGERQQLLDRVGDESIPALVWRDGSVLVGEDEILGFLDSHVVEPAGAEAHRQKARKARKREMEEAARCLEPVTH